MVAIKVLKPKQEHIILRKATKNHRCHECKQNIPKGTFYIEDHLKYIKRKRVGEGIYWFVTNKICLLCWKGPIPKGV